MSQSYVFFVCLFSFCFSIEYGYMALLIIYTTIPKEKNRFSFIENRLYRSYDSDGAELRIVVNRHVICQLFKWPRFYL